MTAVQHGTVLAQRFEVRELAGSGAMGSVYRAIDALSNRPVAIKVLSAMGPSDLARFDREAVVLENLRHPQIVGYVDRGVTDEGRPFLVLEWLEGETLSSRLGNVVPTLEETIQLVQKLARALAHAHTRGIVHRDIKPANVFLLGQGFCEPRLLDFGVARVLSNVNDMTRTGMALGTPVYMAPEQARGRKDVDARADVYALGCLLFECVTGRVPFEGDDVMAVLAKVLFEEPPRLTTLVPATPDALDELVARVLDKEPIKRPQSADELADLLAAIEADMRSTVPDAGGTRSGRPPRPLTTREQRLVAVVGVAPRPSQGPRPGTAATLEADSIVPTIRLATEAARFGATFAPLANGSCIAVLEGEGSAFDLALRAAHCALAFRAQARDLPVALVMGRATTGRVPVGEVIDRVAVLIRANQEGPREPSAIVIDELVGRLIDRRFEVQYGENETLLFRERDEPDRERLLLGKPPPFVGRARELRMLNDLFDEASSEETAAVAMITGPAGTGKSRLVSEWLAGLTKRGEVEVWVGRGDPLSSGSPFGLVASAVRAAARVVRGDPAPVAQRKLRARVEQEEGIAGAERVTHFLAEIVGVPFPDDASPELKAARTDPTLMGDQMRRSFEAFTQAVSAARPLVIVLEDAQWGDLASLRLIEAALRNAKQQPLVAAAVGRLEVTSAMVGLSGFRGAVQLAIGELSKRACKEFVDTLLPAEPEAKRKLIVERAAGNAFFLEELVRWVAEARNASPPTASRGPSSTREAELPPTVIAMLQTRLQGLPAHARRFLRAASIFGHAFWPEGVLHLLGETSSQDSIASGPPSQDTLRAALENLTAQELIASTSPSRFPGKDEFAFRQGLVRDAAYGMLTERDRSAGHRLAGEWLEEAGEREALVLAEHLQRGASGLRAAKWFTEAASHALDGHDFRAAIDLVERAREAMGSEAPGDVLGALLLVDAEARRWSGDLAAAERAARHALEVLPIGSAGWYQASAQLGATAGVRSDFRPVALWRERIASGPCAPDARSARLFALCVVGRRLFQLGDYDAAHELVQTVRRQYESLAHELDPRSEAEVLRLLGAQARHSGDVADDLARYSASLAAYDRAGDVRGACNALVSVGFSHVQIGDHRAARLHLERALEDARRLGLANVETRAHQNLSLVLLAEGRASEALELALRVAREARSRGDERFEGWTLVYASKIALALHEPKQAAQHAETALARLVGSPPAYAGALAAKALALLDLQDLVEADISAREATEILWSYDGIEEFEGLVYLAGVKTALANGEPKRAASLLDSARHRLASKAAKIAEPEARARFLQDVPENAALMALDPALVDKAEPGAETETATPSRPDVPIEEPASRGVHPAVSSRATWSAAAFRHDAAVVVERVAEHLDDTIGRHKPVTNGWRTPDEMLALVPAKIGQTPSLDLPELLELLLTTSPRQHHPRYVGHQVSATVPRATLLALVAACLNNGMAAFESGPCATAMERRVTDWMLDLVGWKEGGGVLASGGSLGNLTALLAARQAKAGFDVRAKGLARNQPLALLVSEQVHYSIERAAQVMGLGRDAVVPIPTDARFRMVPAAIATAASSARERGLEPIALVASAGATGTGSVDPLDEVASACRELGLWFHVDGAHGASALLSPRYTEALRGIERADSLVWDAHKLMSIPALATAVLFRDGKAPYATFAQDAAYLFRGEPQGRWFDIGLRTVECTKPLVGVVLYGCLATMGTGPFRDALEHGYDLAREFASMLRAASDFEVACQPDSNIVCFRHVAGGDLDARQRVVLASLRTAGEFYCVQTTLRGALWLRTSLMNPLTTRADLAALMDAIRAVV